MTDNSRVLSPYDLAVMDQLVDDARKCITAQSELWASVATAHEAGIPWSVIGRALGVTRQAAQERFSKPPAGRLL